jgi:hypothetical protein
LNVFKVIVLVIKEYLTKRFLVESGFNEYEKYILLIGFLKSTTFIYQEEKQLYWSLKNYMGRIS